MEEDEKPEQNVIFSASAYGCAGTVSYSADYKLYLLPFKTIPSASILFSLKKELNLSMEELKQLKSLKENEKFLVPNLTLVNYYDVDNLDYIFTTTKEKHLLKLLVENNIPFSVERT